MNIGDLWESFNKGDWSTGASLLVGLAALVVSLLAVNYLFRPLAALVSRKDPEKVRIARVRRIRLALVIASFAFALFIFRYADNPAAERWGRPAFQLSLLFLILFTFYAVFEIVMTLFGDLLPQLRGKPVASPIFKDLLRTVVFLIVSVYAIRLAFPTADLGSLLATSAIFSLVLGLALQESLSNVFSGIILSVDRPFLAGDWIEIDGKEGKVLDSNWRSTRVWTRSDDVIYVPNSTLAKGNLTNLSRPTKLHWCLREIGVEYGAPPNKVRTVLINMMTQIEGILKEPIPEVRLYNYGDSSITYRLLFAIEDYDRRTRIEAEVMRGVWYHLKRNGISIPFPIRDVYLHRPKPERRPEEILDLLRKVDILRPLQEGELQMLADDLTSQLFARGEVVCRQGEPGSTFYIVKSGVVTVILRSADGVEAEVAQLKAGVYFGEMSLLTGEPRGATCKALEDSELLCLDRESFAVLLREKPAIAQSMSEIIAARQVESNQKLEHERETIIRKRPAPDAGHTKNILDKIWNIFGFTK